MQNDPILGIRVRDVVDNLVWVLQADREEEILLPHKVPPQNIAPSYTLIKELRWWLQAWCVLEKGSRFSVSVMWTLMEKWYERAGVEVLLLRAAA